MWNETEQMWNESERIKYRITVVCVRCGNETFVVESFRDGEPLYACALCGGDPEPFIHLDNTVIYPSSAPYVPVGDAQGPGPA